MLARSLFVVFMEGKLWFGNIEVFEQQARFTRIFAGDVIHFA